MPGSVIVEGAWVTVADGTRLHATIRRPPSSTIEPAACLLEALPYRKDDVTASYADGYDELVVDGGFAVCRLDLRGTGSSAGIAEDEYPEHEVDDLTQVIGWLAAQPWCSGRVGMFGTSYSGFNSLHLAAAGVPELGAVCAMYSSDDRYTDDVHFAGGALRAIDLIDYVTYMVAMNALPPVPAIWGEGWDDEWRRRIDETPPWVLGWLTAQTDGPEWRRGSIRLGPDGAGYERISCPTMLIGGWADGYRNNTFRTVEHLRVPWRLLLGPWSHQAPDTARPGPNLALTPELIGWFDEHLRGGPPRHTHPVQVFVREWTPPEPDQVAIAGSWRSESGWPLTRSGVRPLALGAGVEMLDVRPDTGTTAWISCAGGLPWGQPLDQRTDDVWSLTTDWPMDETTELLGHPRVALRLQSSAPVAFVSAKLCAVAPDGTSALITRGVLNLCHRDSWPASPTGQAGQMPEPLAPDVWYDVVVELEATSWVLEPGQRLRLALAGTDWPNIWPPPAPLTLALDRGASTLSLPIVAAEGRELAAPVFEPGSGPSPVDDGTVWRFEHDVLGRETRAVTHYGGSYEGTHGARIEDAYDGVVGVSTRDPGRAFADGRAEFEVAWPEAVCRSETQVSVRSDASTYQVEVALIVARDGTRIAERHWSETIARHLQ